MKKLKFYNQLFENTNNDISNFDLDWILNKHIYSSKSDTYFEIIKLLIALGAKAEKKSILGSFSVIHNSKDYIKQLDIFSDQIDINDTHYINGLHPNVTLLAMEVIKRDKSMIIIKELLKRGADISFKTWDYASKKNIPLYDFLNDDEIKQIDKSIPGFEDKIIKMKKTNDFNL